MLAFLWHLICLILVSIIHEPRSKCSKINLGRSGRKWFITWTERCKAIGPSKRISFKCITNFDFAWPELLFCVSSPEKFQKQSIHVSGDFKQIYPTETKNDIHNDNIVIRYLTQTCPSQEGGSMEWETKEIKGALKLKTMLAYIMTILQKMPFTPYQMHFKCWGFQRWHTPEFVYFECFEVVKCHLVSSHPNVLNLHKHCGSFFRLCAWVPRSSIFWAKPQIEQCLASDDSAVVSRPWIMKCTYLVYMMYI